MDEPQPAVWLGDQWVGLETFLKNAWVKGADGYWRPMTMDELKQEIERICQT